MLTRCTHLQPELIARKLGQLVSKQRTRLERFGGNLHGCALVLSMWLLVVNYSQNRAAAEFAKDVIPATDQPFWQTRLVLTDTISALSQEQRTQ